MTTLKPASHVVVLFLVAVLLLLGGLFVPQSASLASDHRIDTDAGGFADEDPTRREAELMVRVAKLEASLAQEKAENKSLAVKLEQQQLTNVRLSAAMEITTRELEAKGKQIEKQAELIQKQIETIAAIAEQRAELSQALIEERSQHRRAKDALLRVTENLKRCQAERDALAAELAALRAKEE